MNIILNAAPRVPVHLDDVTVIDQPKVVSRPYDFNAGDERRFNLEEAVELGRLRAIERGIRQQVRPSSPPILGGDPIYLVQDVR